MDVDTEIPLCPSCNHNHIQGIKCHVCGHVGRSQIYQKMRAKANNLRAFKVQIFDSSSVTPSTHGFWEICCELRKQIYNNEMGIPMSAEIDDFEQDSRHIFGLRDAPVSFLRWRFLRTEQDVAVIIDRCAVLPYYRRKGFGKRMLETALADINLIVINQNIQIQRIHIQILDEEWILGKLLLAGWEKTYNTETRGGRTFITVIQERV